MMVSEFAYSLAVQHPCSEINCCPTCQQYPNDTDSICSGTLPSPFQVLSYHSKGKICDRIKGIKTLIFATLHLNDIIIPVLLIFLLHAELTQDKT